MQTEKTGVVYRIYHKASMKSYIGKSVRSIERINKHFNGNGGSPVLCRAIKKYGADAFRVEIIESDAPESWLSKMEILHIRFFNSKTPNGYNLTDGGEGVSGMTGHIAWNKGKVLSPEHRQKISEASKGKVLSPETRQKISEASKGRTAWNKGKPAWNKGKSPSPETRQKLSESKTNPSPETRRKMSEAKKGKVLSPEHRQKISVAGKGRTAWNKGKPAWNKGKSPSPETRRKLSESHKGKTGKTHSPETRQKISESLKRRNRSS